MVGELASGLCFVIEVTSIEHGEDTPTVFRQLVGPSDPVSSIIPNISFLNLSGVIC